MKSYIDLALVALIITCILNSIAVYFNIHEVIYGVVMYMAVYSWLYIMHKR